METHQTEILSDSFTKAVEAHLVCFSINPDFVRTIVSDHCVFWNFLTDDGISVYLRVYRYQDEVIYFQGEAAFAQATNEQHEITKILFSKMCSVPHPLRVCRNNNVLVTQFWFKEDQVNPTAIDGLIQLLILFARDCRESIRNLEHFCDLNFSDVPGESRVH